MPSFLFRDAPVHYTVHGEGAALLLIHGAGGNAMNWSPHLRRLAGHTVSAIDLPGHGNSAGAPPLATIADFAEMALAWADAIGAATFAIAGQSLGAAIALQVALDAPQRVTHLIPIACAPKIIVNPTLLDALRDGDDAVYATLTRFSYARNTPPERLARFEAHLRKCSLKVLWGAFAACSTFDITAQLSEITAPTCILGATADRMIPIEGSVKLHRGIPTSHLHVVENSGHMIHVEAPDVVTDIVTEMLSA